MSYAIPYYSDEPVLHYASEPELEFVPRSKLQWLPMLLPVALTGLSWISGGAPGLTDMGFLLLTLWCAIALALELYYFPRRFGIGGILLWGGVLIWFCQDYFVHWWGLNFAQDLRMPAVVIAKAAFLHMLFITLMAVGLSIDKGKWAVKAITIVPEPGDDRFYFWVVIALFIFGLIPYVFFSAEPWYLCMYHNAFKCWTEDPKFTVTRTGNLNTSWGGYVAQIMQVGEMGGMLAIVYSILVAKSLRQWLVAVPIWVFYTLVSYQSGSRGAFIFDIIPAIALLFIRFQARTAMAMKKVNLWPLVICILLAAGTNLVVQIQATYRTVGLQNVDLTKVEFTGNKGNTMFSEGLLGYSLIPEVHPFFYGDFPGEGAFVAIPKTAIDFVVGIIPRALWHDKPVDGLWEWYNHVYQGTGREGTTISKGLVGSWYFKYGIVGMMEGAVLVGWLMGVSERALQFSNGRPMHIMFSLAFATWLFRTFRDFAFPDLYGVVLAAILLCILIPLLRPIMGVPAPSGQ
jgi:hypothetical protein